MNKMAELAQRGQAIWYDFIRRSFMNSGEMRQLVEQGLRGMTSNPAIFEKAIAENDDYDEAIYELTESGFDHLQIYESLVLEDIRLAAEILRPVYEVSGGLDGYVSLEVSPELAYKYEDTVEEAKRLHAALNLPNVMIKVPATKQGYLSVRKLTAAGINVNATLIFSIEHYCNIAEAYISGLEKRVENGEEISNISSVASFFVSRIDTAVDKKLNEQKITDLQGKIAVANCKLAYQEFRKIFSGPRWEALKEKGARVQRLLWASTGTKNPAYPDTFYVDELIGPDTVNTLPPATLKAWLDHGKLDESVTKDPDRAEAYMEQLQQYSIDLNEITVKLQKDGIRAFADAFERLLIAVAAKSERLTRKQSRMTVFAGRFAGEYEQATVELGEKDIVNRLWRRDHTIWKEKPDEISNRLGWLESPQLMEQKIPVIRHFVREAKKDQFRHALLLGMGGSSLAPEVFARVFGRRENALRLQVLDTTDPETVNRVAGQIDWKHTLFIASTKSGGTVETLSLMKYFYNRLLNKFGKTEAGNQFVAITDPGSSLEKLARELDFRQIFLNDPNIGGRFSVISYFGLVPAALCGVNLEKLLERTKIMIGKGQKEAPKNTPARLGALMGRLTNLGADKITLMLDPQVAPFGNWLEQLIAESTGKEGKGILPVQEPYPMPVDAYGKDRLFVIIRLQQSSRFDTVLQDLKQAGQPLVDIVMSDLYDLGGEFLRWELATALSGYFLHINPFDQPNVESAKILAREKTEMFRKEGKLPQPQPVAQSEGLAVYGNMQGQSVKEVYESFLDGMLQDGKEQEYLCLQAFLTPEKNTYRALSALRQNLQKKFGVAVTYGFGPRYLHSTGQLHKGDSGHGRFIQLTIDYNKQVPIPDEAGENESGMDFGSLIMAQALGDFEALQKAGRKVIRIHLGRDGLRGVQQLIRWLEE